MITNYILRNMLYNTSRILVYIYIYIYTFESLTLVYIYMYYVHFIPKGEQSEQVI